MTFEEAIQCSHPLDAHAAKQAQKRLDNLTKPLGSLGKLEDIIKRLSAIYGRADFDLTKKAVLIFCGDNGVVEEGVSSCPKEVTASVTRNFMTGITGINVLTRFAGADIFVVDVGVDADLSDVPGIRNKKIRRGTWNIARGPAMTREEAISCIEAGIEVVEELKNKGYKLLATGEMGIGNTTTSSAVSAVLTGDAPERMVGKGAGLTKEAYLHKIGIVREAIRRNDPDPADPVDVLAKVGGFDIAGLVGCFLGASAVGLPILMDGFISSVAALLAFKINPRTKDFMFPTHCSAEPGARSVLQAMDFEEMVKLDMRLGEGTGAAICFPIFDAAYLAYTQMGTFQDAQIEQYMPIA